MKIDKNWFIEKIKNSPYGTIRKISPEIKIRSGAPLGHSQLSKTLSGTRSMTIEEAFQIATLLNIPVSDIINHLGLPHKLDEGGNGKQVTIIGYLDKNLELNHFKANERQTADGPHDLPNDAIAVRCVTARSENNLTDGWVLFAEKQRPFKNDVFQRLCLLAPKGGQPTVGFIMRGYNKETVNLMVGFCDTLRPVSNVTLDWVAPVLWVKT